MKHKLKKWHIALMSFIALFIAVFASLFNLKADTVDEETGEIITDNWELSTVFYDSTVDNGKTPLTEINWDASDGSYKDGTPRVITVQINYKNNSAVTTYQPGDLEIKIPNLIYSNKDEEGTAYDALWETSVLIGANDATHTGYDWTLKGSGSNYVFTNAHTIEEKANFEGTIKIVYTITPKNETPEKYEDSCIHNFTKNIQAFLEIEKLYGNTVITSPNWPEDYPASMKKDEYFWEYSNENAKEIVIIFDSNSNTYRGVDFIYIYDKDGTELYKLSGTQMAGKTYTVQGNYVKFAMSSHTYASGYNGFSAQVSYRKIFQLNSNNLPFNYTRTYTHPWEKREFEIDKTASKITSLDGLPAGNYYWVKYDFTIKQKPQYSQWQDQYPYIGVDFYFTDMFPLDCIIVDKNSNVLSLENGIYKADDLLRVTNTYITDYIYVGYPKSIYNEENNNLNITNHTDLYVKYNSEEEYFFAAYDDVSLNLSEYIFEYSGELYGIQKSDHRVSGNDYFRYQDIIGDLTYNSQWYELSPTAIYTGSPMTVKIGDDLLYATNKEGEYSKVNDEGYYFKNIYFPYLKNGNNQIITTGKYNCELWVRYANNSDYTLYEEFTNKYKQWSFSKENHIVGYYFLIKDMQESLTDSNFTLSLKFIDPNIPQDGFLHNFAYLQVFFKDVNGNLILQNEPTLDSYANLITQNEIATFDQSTYGTYMQRSTAYDYWSYYDLKLISTITTRKTAGTITQDIENEQFTGSYKIFNTIKSNMWHTEYFDYTKTAQDEDKIYGFIFYDLLPAGMEVTSTEEQIIKSANFETSSIYWNKGAYATKANGTPFSSVSEFMTFIKNNTYVEIINNYNNTGRMLLRIITDFSDDPICCFSNDSYSDYPCKISFSFNYSIPYDAYLEYGSVWENIVYLDYHNRTKNQRVSGTQDNGKYDKDAVDINNNGNTSESIAYAKASTTITSVISTHQDVTTYVQTDQSNYSTGTVDASCNSEYKYKLRVRTGAADVTNLIIYTNIEEAQPKRTRWKGEFLDIDTSYAENKGYVVKPYYSENPTAGNLYNEDGTLNSDWKEYIPDTPEIVANGLAITFDENFKTYTSSDYLYIYYYYNGQLYRSSKYYDTTLANQTIEIPSTDVYFYWYTSSSGNSAYGFKVNNIEPKVVTTTLGSTTTSLPNYTPIELTENNYPETAHNPYENNSTILWHYTYTGNLVFEERIEHIDKTKVKSLAFKYLDSNGNFAVLPANSLTYVLIKMNSPVDESIKTLARMDCWTQWNAIDAYGRPVDFITGINSNVVKVALPNSVKTDDLPSISLRFTKEIQGETSGFENLKLNKADEHIFMIRLTSLTQNDDGTYNQVTGMLSSNTGLIISQIPIGTYLLEELDDNYFDFVDFTDNNDPEIIINGVTFERTDQGYIITVSEDLAETVEFNIKVTNEIEPERFYEDKNNKENLFLINKINNGMMGDDPEGQ